MYKSRQTHKLAEIKGGDWYWATDEYTNEGRKEDVDLIKKKWIYHHKKAYLSLLSNLNWHSIDL